MKKIILLGLIVLFIIGSCTQKAKESETAIKIENTIKSVNFLIDSIGISPSELLASFERINKAIDSIGYPDAGYKLWIVQIDTNKTYKFMGESNWPDQATYDLIHNHELYKNATKAEEKIWAGMKSYLYDRFTLVK